MVHLILALEQDLRHGDYLIALGNKILDYLRQGLGGVFGGVVKEDYGAGLDIAADTVEDLTGGDVLPVKAVPTGSGFKCLF